MKRLTILQPFLFALFPIFSLFASNLNLVRPAEIALPAAIALGATVPLFALATLLLRSKEAGAIVVSVFWVLFFSYGRFVTLVGGGQSGHGTYVLIGLAVLFALTVAAAAKWRARMRDVAPILTIVGLTMLAMPLAGAAVVEVRHRVLPVREPVFRVAPSHAEQGAPGYASPGTATPGAAPAAAPEGTPQPVPPSPTPTPMPTPARPPDIYYIILDGYGRADVLKDLYALDNSEFLNYLTEKGFYVATDSHANYCQTYMSLGSSLNLSYLDQVVERLGIASADRKPLQDLVRDNAVVRFLKERGYTYVGVSTGYADAELRKADVYIAAPWSLTQFQSGLINTTPISPLVGLQYELHRQRLLYAFEHLPDATQAPAPRFLVAHIAAPHPPFVFDENGGSITPNREFLYSDGSHYMATGTREEYVTRYAAQLRFVNRKVQAMIDAILARSTDPPIIILQSDHGPGSRLSWYSVARTNLRERMSILNAYYLPGGGREQLYPSITPVNTFRLILDRYFGTRYGLLEDQSYFSLWDRPNEFIPVQFDEQGEGSALSAPQATPTPTPAG